MPLSMTATVCPVPMKAVIVANLREARQAVRAGERLLDIAQQRVDVAFAAGIDPEVGVADRRDDTSWRRIFRKAAVMLDHRHFADERLRERDHEPTVPADITRRSSSHSIDRVRDLRRREFFAAMRTYPHACTVALTTGQAARM